MQGVLPLPVVCRNQFPWNNIKSASAPIPFDTPVLEWFEKHHKNYERCARFPTGMAEIQNYQPIDLSEFVRETHVCLKNNDYDGRAETKQKNKKYYVP